MHMVGHFSTPIDSKTPVEFPGLGRPRCYFIVIRNEKAEDDEE
jgi:hypothetical protein